MLVATCHGVAACHGDRNHHDSTSSHGQIRWQLNVHQNSDFMGLSQPQLGLSLRAHFQTLISLMNNESKGSSRNSLPRLDPRKYYFHEFLCILWVLYLSYLNSYDCLWSVWRAIIEEGNAPFHQIKDKGPSAVSSSGPSV